MKKARWLSILISLALMFGLVTGCGTAEYTVSQATVTPERIIVGDTYTVQIEVSNVGNADGTYTAALFVDGNTVDSKDVMVVAGESHTVAFTQTASTAGKHTLRINEAAAEFTALKPAEFKVSDFTMPARTLVGDPITVQARITNSGEVEGTYESELTVDGVIAQTKKVVVAPGATEMVSFEMEESKGRECSVCIGDTTQTLSVLEPYDVVKAAYDSMQAYETMDAAVGMSVYIAAEDEGQLTEVEMMMDFSLIADIPAKQLEMTGFVEMDMTGEETQTVEMESYISDNVMLARVEMPGQPVQEVSSPIPGDIWESLEAQQMMSQQLDLILDAEVNYLGTETIDGIECYIFEVIPSKESFLEAMFAQQGTAGQSSDAALDLDEVTAALFVQVMDMSMKMWVSKESLVVKRTELDMEIDLSSMGVYMGMTADVEIYSINEPVTVNLPEGM